MFRSCLEVIGSLFGKINHKASADFADRILLPYIQFFFFRKHIETTDKGDKKDKEKGVSSLSSLTSACTVQKARVWLNFLNVR